MRLPVQLGPIEAFLQVSAALLYDDDCIHLMYFTVLSLARIRRLLGRRDAYPSYDMGQ